MADNNVSNPTLKPRRGSYNSMHDSDTVLEDGEIFFEIGNNGIPTTGPDAISFGKIKMGDGFTAYNDLGYFVDVDTTAVDWDNSGYATATSESQGADLYGNLNDIKPSATVKSIFANIKALLYKLATKVTTLNNKVPFSFGVDADGNYGYKKAGADTVTPFKTVGTRSSSITANGTYTAISDINKDGYSSVTVAVPNNVQTKTVTAGTSNKDVTPDSGYIGMSKVTVAPTPTQIKTTTASTSNVTVTPDTGKFLSSVIVEPTPTETKTVTPTTSGQTVTPSGGKYLSSVTVNAINTQTKSVTADTVSKEVTPDAGKFLSAVTVHPTPSHAKTVTANTQTIEVLPNSGAFLAKVTVNPQEHHTTKEYNYDVMPDDDDIDDFFDLGANHNVRYIHIMINTHN